MIDGTKPLARAVEMIEESIDGLNEIRISEEHDSSDHSAERNFYENTIREAVWYLRDALPIRKGEEISW